VGLVLERLRIALDQCLARLAEASSGEAIHDCRVAARKLRVAARALRRRPMQVRTGPVSKELDALLEGLAPARNADVRLQTLRDILLKSGSMNARKSRELLALAYAQHALLRRELSNLMKSPRWARRREKLAQRTMEVATLLEGREPAPQSMKEMIQRRDRGLRRRMRQIERSPEKIHRLRLRIKELRYLLESFEPLSAELDCVDLKKLGRLQDLIGEFHDLWSLGRWLESDAPGDLVSRGLRRSLLTAQNRLLDKILSDCRGHRTGR
jgi:CHAD domain-containing protein